MKRIIIFAVTALALSGCTVLQETLSPHHELKSPCVCADDATPINAQIGDVA